VGVQNKLRQRPHGPGTNLKPVPVGMRLLQPLSLKLILLLLVRVHFTERRGAVSNTKLA